MTTEKNAREKLILGATKGHEVRFSYLNVFEARPNRQNGVMEYSVMLLVPKTSPDVALIQGAIEKLKNETWVSKGKRVPPKFWNPLRDGDKDCKQNGDPFGPEAKGHYLLSAKTFEDTPPMVVGTTRDEKGKLLPLTKNQIKSGDYGRASVNLSAYLKGDTGVAAYLNNIQLVRQGESLGGGGADADQDFGDFEDDEVDPLG